MRNIRLRTSVSRLDVAMSTLSSNITLQHRVHARLIPRTFSFEPFDNFDVEANRQLALRAGNAYLDGAQVDLAFLADIDVCFELGLRLIVDERPVGPILSMA